MSTLLYTDELASDHMFKRSRLDLSFFWQLPADPRKKGAILLIVGFQMVITAGLFHHRRETIKKGAAGAVQPAVVASTVPSPPK